MHIVFLSLGTNLGDKEKNLNDAIANIQRRIGSVMATSAFVQTEPWGFESPNSFLNAALKVSTALSPLEVLHASQQIEKKMGRTAKSKDGVYHDRVIDIDLLMYFESEECSGEGVMFNTKELVLPHPLMNGRDFVMIPLKQIL